MQQDLTTGSVVKNLIRFSLPYLLACFLQTFYGLADLFITGQFNGAASISAVSIGSQLMHMLTVMIVGLAMGSTVLISRAVGAKDRRTAAKGIGNATVLFLGLSLVLTAVFILLASSALSALETPAEAFDQARQYVLICFIGIPFITAYNVISSIFRGLGDTKSPMYFVAAAGVINILLDYILIGPMHMAAAGAALATVLSQTISVLIALMALRKKLAGWGISRSDFRIDRGILRQILTVGVPICCQDGLIQISFLVITAIANSRGVNVAASVGIVEKIICFMFLVPSAMLSSVSALAAQNAGAGKHRRGRQTLYWGLAVGIAFGLLMTVLCQFLAEPIVGLFTKNEPEVVVLGGQYLRAYVLDCMFAAIHFCFSGYFCAYKKAGYSFIHNITSILVVRIPGAYLASIYFPQTLFPMGLAAPMGSLLSALICIWLYRKNNRAFERQ